MIVVQERLNTVSFYKNSKCWIEDSKNKFIFIYLEGVLKSLTNIRLYLVLLSSVLLTWIVIGEDSILSVVKTFFIVFLFVFSTVELNFLVAKNAVRKSGVSWVLFLAAFCVISFLIGLLFTEATPLLFEEGKALVKAVGSYSFLFIVFFCMVGLFLAFYVIFQKKYRSEELLINDKQVYLQQSFNALKSQNVIEFLKDALEQTKKLIVSDSAVAVLQLEKLTTILRHLLQNRDKRFVQLNKELDIVEEYCKLAEIHLDKEIDLLVQVDKEFFDTMVPPLVFQMILDHQFLFYKNDKAKLLEIEVYVENRNFVVIKTSLPSKKMAKDQSNDRFINNLKARYQLYNDAADVSILSTSEFHFVKVPLLSK